MLPILLGGAALLGLGKLIYEAVTDDDKPSSSSSSSSGPSETEIARARQERQAAQLQQGTSELLNQTAASVTALLKAHKGLVLGAAKPPLAAVPGKNVINPLAAWPFPTEVARANETSEQGAEAALTIDDLHKSVQLAEQGQDIDALKHLTVGLRYQESYIEQERAVADLVAQRQALMRVMEAL